MTGIAVRYNDLTETQRELLLDIALGNVDEDGARRRGPRPKHWFPTEMRELMELNLVEARGVRAALTQGGHNCLHDKGGQLEEVVRTDHRGDHNRRSLSKDEIRVLRNIRDHQTPTHGVRGRDYAALLPIVQRLVYMKLVHSLGDTDLWRPNFVLTDKGNAYLTMTEL